MKKSGNKGNKKVILVMVLLLVFAVGIIGGITAGKYIAGKDERETSKLSSGTKDSAQNESGNQKTAAKKTDKKDETKEQNPAKEENEQGTSQTKDDAAAVSTYDASVPADDTSIHRYDFVVDDCTWQEAYQNCINQGGYLVRINTNKEYEYIRKEISARGMTDMFFRIGGRRDAGSSDYYWVNQNNKLFGEKLNGTDSWAIDEWKKGEPSFKDGNLDELYMNLFFFDGEKRFVWNDVPDDMLTAEPLYAGKLGYICEYE